VRYIILLEQTGTGFAVQVPDLAISAYGSDIQSAKHAAEEAIRINRPLAKVNFNPIKSKVQLPVLQEV